MKDKYIVLYCNDRFLLPNIGLEPFNSPEEAKERISYFESHGHLGDAKIYKLTEINDD